MSHLLAMMARSTAAIAGVLATRLTPTHTRIPAGMLARTLPLCFEVAGYTTHSCRQVSKHTTRFTTFRKHCVARQTGCLDSLARAAGLCACAALAPVQGIAQHHSVCTLCALGQWVSRTVREQVVEPDRETGCGDECCGCPATYSQDRQVRRGGGAWCC